jgi:predicted regulator of Ras-like GTPase activity (Roadblock/LC7/MglB family)
VGFLDTLRGVARRVPEARALLIIGTDGIPVERLLLSQDPNLEAMAAELATLVRSTLGSTADTGLGDLRELSLVSSGMTALIMEITPQYYLFVSLGPGGVIGRARAAMRVACVTLEREFA